MKKIIICITCLCATFTISVYAHNGKTDDNGGHYDHETGEYHYHHGYPAHQHINGVCPYDFDDQTDHSPGTSSGTSEYKPFVPITPQPDITPKVTLSPELREKYYGYSSFWDFLPFIIFGGIVFFFLLLGVIVSDKPKPIYTAPITENSKRAYITPIVNIYRLPKSIRINGSLLPYTLEEPYYGYEFTVVKTKNGRCYHKLTCGRVKGHQLKYLHLYKAMRYYSPCAYCKPKTKEDKWYIDLMKKLRVDLNNI